MRDQAHAAMTFLLFSAALWIPGCGRGSTGAAVRRDSDASDSGQARIESAYRCDTGTNTMYFVFLSDGTYGLIAREHMFTARLERGTWRREANGELLIARRGETCHLVPVEYRSLTFLSSPDHEIVSIWAPTARAGKERIDEMGSDGPENPSGLRLFVVADPAICAQEWRTPQSPGFSRGAEAHPILDLDP